MASLLLIRLLLDDGREENRKNDHFGWNQPTTLSDTEQMRQTRDLTTIAVQRSPRRLEPCSSRMRGCATQSIVSTCRLPGPLSPSEISTSQLLRKITRYRTVIITHIPSLSLCLSYPPPNSPRRSSPPPRFKKTSPSVPRSAVTRRSSVLPTSLPPSTTPLSTSPI